MKKRSVKEMMSLIILFCAFLVVSVCGDDLTLLNDDDEWDSILINMLKGEGVTDNKDDHEVVKYEEEEPQLTDGIWKCGNCSDIGDSNLILTETYNLETNYGEETEIELQVGFSLNNMRCLTIETGAIAVRRVMGACASGDVTLSIIHKSDFDVKIYS